MYSGYIVSNPVCMLVESDCPYRLDKMGNPNRMLLTQTESLEVISIGISVCDYTAF